MAQFVKSYLLEDGTFPVNMFGGGGVRPNGKTMDVWATSSWPNVFREGSNVNLSSKQVDVWQLRSQGYLIRVNLYSPG